MILKKIAEEFLLRKSSGDIIVIHHSDIDKNDRRFLEKQLIDCDNRFKTGLADKPHERHKGEIVSAIYAEYFEIPFLKSNDGTFREGEAGSIAFPNLVVKNLRDMLNDLVVEEGKRREYLRMIKDNRDFMDEGKRIYETAPVTQVRVDLLLSKLRRKL